MLTLAAILAFGLNLEPLPPFQPAMREFRGAWVASVDNIDWPSRKDLTSEQQQKELMRIFDVAEKVGLNAIIFQIRTSCDALYPSKFEPWSEFLTGRQGKAPDPYYDPLAYAIELAHARGIELHVWFNPYRAKHFKATGPLSDTHIFKTRPDLAKQYGRYIWMDPGETETPKKTLEVMLDVVKRYDIDGVHIDDYFYPYAEKNSNGMAIPFPDQPSFQKYVDRGGTLSKKDWRRQNVDAFIQKMYTSVKAEKSWVKVGISPFGIARPNLPKGIKAGIDQYDDPLYADCQKWFKEGWCDYFTPQLYWPINSPGQPYKKLLQWWSDQNLKNRALWPGNYTGKVFAENGNWTVEEVENQIRATRNIKGAGGNVHFSFKCFNQNQKGLTDKLGAKLYKSKALVPAMPWLSSSKPEAPTAKRVNGGGEVSIQWSEIKGVREWAVYRLRNKTWSLDSVLPSNGLETLFTSTDFESSEAFAITAISPTGIESEPAYIRTANL